MFWIRIQFVSVFSSVVDPNPSGLTQLKTNSRQFSVSDPYLLNPDPDPAKNLNPDLDPDPDPDPGKFFSPAKKFA